MNKHRFLVFLPLLGILPILSACAGKPPVKVYYLDKDVGLIRKQDQEILTFTQAQGYFCTSPDDLERLVQRYMGTQK